jgi:hypothetical protein
LIESINYFFDRINKLKIFKLNEINEKYIKIKLFKTLLTHFVTHFVLDALLIEEVKVLLKFLYGSSNVLGVESLLSRFL